MKAKQSTISKRLKDLEQIFYQDKGRHAIFDGLNDRINEAEIERKQFSIDLLKRMTELANKVQWSKEKVEVHEITMNTHEEKMDQFKNELKKYNE